ncbi:MAG: hypothetical protein ABI411_02765 [Tahibacter sp.]
MHSRMATLAGFGALLMLIFAQFSLASGVPSFPEPGTEHATFSDTRGSSAELTDGSAARAASHAGVSGALRGAAQVAAAAPITAGTFVGFGAVRHGCNGPINAAVTMTNGDRVLGGNFSACGGVLVNGLARWDGVQWYAYANVSNGWLGEVKALVAVGNDLYVGGNGAAISTVEGSVSYYFARWDGSAWHAYASDTAHQLNGPVNAIALNGSDLYIGGEFTGIGDGEVVRSHVARWIAGAWQPLGSETTNGVDGSVNALVVDGSTVYVGGAFAAAAGVVANRIARWNGSAWSSVGSGAQNGFDNTVWTIQMNGSDLIVGGAFQRAGGQLSGGIARWNGSQWFPIGSNPAGVTGTVRVLRMVAGQMVVGGSLSFAGNLPISNVGSWNGSTWSALGGGVGDSSAASSDSVRALTQWNGQIHAFGTFTQSTGVITNGVARWDGSAWRALIDPTDTTQVTGEIYAMLSNGSDVYVGGAISQVGNLAVNNIARWNGSAWSAVGAGVNGPVNSLAIDGGVLYVGGDFSMAGGQTASNLAQWDGSSWHPVGNVGAQGTDGGVTSLAATAGRLYAGGFFTHAGGFSTPHIAMYTNGVWSGLADGTDSEVYALATDSAYLYAGGRFLRAGPIAANHIARWNGVQWDTLPNPLGNGDNGVNSAVYALQRFGNKLYVGGQFSQFGATPSAKVAIWSSGVWSSPGGGIPNSSSDTIMTLQVFAGRLYAASYNGALYVWDGTDWGLVGFASFAVNRALAVLGARLYMGGVMSRFGNAASTGIVGFVPEQIFRNGFQAVPLL